MKKILYILTALLTTVSFGQINAPDCEKPELLIDNYQNHTDSIKQLTNGAKVYYVSDPVFKGMILTLQNGEKIELDLRYKESSGGYTEIGADFEKFLLLKYRGDGSGNPEQLRVINKKTGKDGWLGDYPFYIDKENEVGVYISYTDSSFQIIIHDFSKNKIEKYPAPATECICCECFEILDFNEESFTIKFVDPENNNKELIIKRRK